MRLRRKRFAAVLPMVTAALLAGTGFSALAANDEKADGTPSARIAPPPRPVVQTLVEPGEGREAMKRHRHAHSHNEQKMRGLLRAKQAGAEQQPAKPQKNKIK